ncbi:unnamed protein product [Closterium sp. NIES-53]
MYLMTCTRPDLAYPLSLLARYVAHGRHRKVQRDVAKRVLRYLCSTSGMGRVLVGRGSVVLTGHSDASWADDQATQRLSQGYTFSLGSGSVSWRSTRSSSVLGSSCEAEIYAGAMAAQELRWLTYLLADLGERPHSPPVLYVDNKQRHQLRLSYVASRANTADVFTKALGCGDHQRFCAALGLIVRRCLPMLPVRALSTASVSSPTSLTARHVASNRAPTSTATPSDSHLPVLQPHFRPMSLSRPCFLARGSFALRGARAKLPSRGIATQVVPLLTRTDGHPLSSARLSAAGVRSAVSPRASLPRMVGPTEQRGSPAVAAAAAAATAATSPVPSLEELRATVEERAGAPLGQRERLSKAAQRLFGAAESDVRVTLYRDNSAWCPYCERVWLQLEEKQIPYVVEKINMRCYGPKPDWFMQMVPSGLLPVLKLDGRVITESLDIMFAIESAFPSHTPLLPPSSDRAATQRVERLLRLERQLAGAWLQWSRMGDGAGGLMGGMFRRGGGGGMGAGQRMFEEALDAVDAALLEGGGPLFMGEQLSMVDAVYAPFLERTAASIPFWKGLTVRGNPRWPALNAWFTAMDVRPPYLAMKSDDFTITHTLEPQIGPVVLADAGAAHRDYIEGRDGTGAWDLPLQPEVTAWGEDDGTGGPGRQAQQEAVESISLNHELLVSFCLRALRQQSFPRQRATLVGGRPRLQPPSDAELEAARERLAPAVSEALRHVAYVLLEGTEAVGAAVPAGLLGALSGEEQEEVAVCVAYLRDRVGVPRDLTYPAARQLRAHLQWMVRLLGSKV